MEKSRLKNYFKTGARPTESQFGQLIDAMALEEEVLKEEALAPVTEALNSQEGRLSAVETACASQTTDVATLQTAVDDLRTAEAGHGERLESLEQLMDDQWQTIDGIDLKATLVAQQVVDHPEAEELGHFDTVEELDAALSEALEGFCAQGVYASYVWNDEYGIRSRRYELDPDTGLPVATGERCIGTVTASVGTPAKACTTWLTYTLYDYEHDGGNPALESRLERPVYEVQAVRLYGGTWQEGKAPRTGWGDAEPAAWTWEAATHQEALEAKVQALEGAVNALSAGGSGSGSGEALTGLTGRLDTAEGKIGTLEGRVATMEGELATARQATSDLSDATDDALAQLRGSMAAETQARTSRDAALQTQIDAHTTTIGGCATKAELTAEAQARSDGDAALAARLDAIEAAGQDAGGGTEDATRKVLEGYTSYVAIEQAILADLRTEGNPVREWVADFPQNGGVDTWHYRLLSVGSTGLLKVERTNAAGISVLTASARSTSWTATQKLAF